MTIRSKIMVAGAIACMAGFSMPAHALKLTIGDPFVEQEALCSSQFVKDIVAADSACTGAQKDGKSGNCSANDVTSANPAPNGSVTVTCSCPSDPGATPPGDKTINLTNPYNSYNPPFSAQNLSACAAFNTTAITCTNVGGKVFCKGKQMIFK